MSGILNPKALEYQTVAASQTNAKLGLTGAVGDYLDKLIVTVTTAASGTVTVTDGQTSTLAKDLPYLPFSSNVDGPGGSPSINTIYFNTANLTNWPTSGYLKIVGYADVNNSPVGPYTNIVHYTSVAYDGDQGEWYVTTDQVGCFGTAAIAISGNYENEITGLTAQITSVTNLPPNGVIGITTGAATEYVSYTSISGNQLLITSRAENGSTIAAHVATNATSLGSTFAVTAANTPIGVYTVPMTTQCVSNAWRITTGAGASVVAVGQFT